MTCGQSPFVTVFNTFIAGLRQHRSVAVGGSNVQFEPDWTVLFVAQVRTGGVVSTIVIVCLQVFVLPQQSRASQIRIMNCGQVPLVNVPNIETPCRQQLSVAVGVPNSQEEPHSKVRSGGQNVNTGGVVSTTVIFWLQVLVLPQQSEATQTRVRTNGQLGLFVKVPKIVTPARQQLSVAIGVSKEQFEPHSTVRFVGHNVNNRGVVSTIVIGWLQVLVLPQQSSATQTRVIICGQMLVLVNVPNTAIPWRQQLSVAVGVPKVQGVPHSTVRLV